MKLYICLMPFIGSVPGEQSLAGGVNAPLRLIPRDPSDFRVMAPFHHAGGLLCEAELKPFAAAGLMSDIVRVINQGNSRGPHVTRGAKREAPDERHNNAAAASSPTAAGGSPRICCGGTGRA